MEMKSILYVIVLSLILVLVNSANYNSYNWTGPPGTTDNFMVEINWSPPMIPLNKNFTLDNGGSILLTMEDITVERAVITYNLFYIVLGYLYATEQIDVTGSLSLGKEAGFFCDKTINFIGAQIFTIKYTTVKYDGFISAFNMNFISSTIIIDTGSILEIGLTTEYAFFNGTKIIIGDNSEFNGYSTFELHNTSIINQGLNSSLGFLKPFEAFDSYIRFNNSNLTINNVLLNGNSFLFIENSRLYLNGNLELYDDTFMKFNKSIVFTYGDLVLFNNSYLESIGSFKGDIIDIIISSNGNINQTWIDIFDSLLLIKGSIISLDDTSFEMENTMLSNTGEIIVFNYFKTLNSVSIFGGTTVLQGVVNSKRSVFFVNYSLIVNSQAMGLSDSLFYVYFDTFINGNLSCQNSQITVLNGTFYATSISNTELINSAIFVRKGDIIIHPSAGFIMVDSFLIVSEFGNIIISSSEIFLNEKSNITNYGTFQLGHGGVYYGDNVLEKNGNVLISNNGLFKILNSTNINVAFDNYENGTLNIGSNSLFIHKFNQSNGQLSIDNGILDSDTIINVNGGYVSGNGLFNSSINHLGGEIGSRLSSNKINISNDFIQTKNGSGGLIAIVINSLNDFSSFNIGNYVDIIGDIDIILNLNLINQIISNDGDNSISEPKSSLSSLSADGYNFNLINFKSKSEQSFKSNKITFKSYSPENGENEIDKCIQSTSSSSSSSFSILLSNSCSTNTNNGKSSLSGGSIAGIVIGITAAVAIVGSIIHFKERIRLRFISSSVGIKLKQKLSK